MTRRRKILLGAAGVVAALGLVLALLASLDLWRATRRVAEFTRRHADAPRQAEAAAMRISRALSPRGEGATMATASREAAPPRPPLRRNIYPVCEEFEKAFDEYDNAYEKASWPLWMEAYTDGMELTLPAEEFIALHAAASRLGDLPALRARILREVEVKMAEDQHLRSTLKPMPRDALTSGPLAARLSHALDQAREMLMDDWDDFTTTKEGAPPYGSIWEGVGAPACFGWMSAMAIEREACRGKTREALRMLEGLIRAAAILRLKTKYLYLPPDRELQQTIVRLARLGALDEAALARLDDLLARGRLSDAELANLRAAAALARMKAFQERQAEIRHRYSAKARLKEKLLMWTTEKWGENDYLATMAAWGAGDGEACDEAKAHYLVMTRALPIFTSGDAMLGTRGVPMTNEALDTTRLIVAAERWRLAHGEYPATMAGLRPAYLDATFDDHPADFWAVERLTLGGAATWQPVFYHARHTPVSLVQCYFTSSWRVNRLGLLEKPRPWMDWVGLGSSENAFLMKLWSNEYTDAVVVQAVWPWMEEPELKW